MTDLLASQGNTLVAAQVGGIDTQVSQGVALVAANFPSEFTLVSQAAVMTAGPNQPDVNVSQGVALVAGRGRIDNRRVRAWPELLDGHDLYFLRLGDETTLVFDLTTEQWATWSSPDMTAWRPNTGFNWLGLGKVAYDDGHTSNAVLGDDTYGLLWTMDPTTGLDQSPRSDRDDRPYTRRVVGGVPMRLRETQKVGAAYVTASIGEPLPLTGANITLRTSDDNGKTWLDHGTVVATAGPPWDQEFVWRSLGLIKAPGRIFEITDDGATVRIDGLDIR